MGPRKTHHSATFTTPLPASLPHLTVSSLCVLLGFFNSFFPPLTRFVASLIISPSHPPRYFLPIIHQLPSTHPDGHKMDAKSQMPNNSQDGVF